LLKYGRHSTSNKPKYVDVVVGGRFLAEQVKKPKYVPVGWFLTPLLSDIYQILAIGRPKVLARRFRRGGHLPDRTQQFQESCSFLRTK
jgi:hypothetical protein